MRRKGITARRIQLVIRSIALICFLLCSSPIFAESGFDWTLGASIAPWQGKEGASWVVYNDNLWIMGGRVGNLAVSNDVWRSSDGISGQCVTQSAAWAARLGHSSVVFNNRMWVIGGSHWTASSVFYHDVWYSSDGMAWQQATASAPWTERAYHASVVYRDQIWVIGGNGSGGPKADVWSSSDGANWRQTCSAAPWGARTGLVCVVFSNRMWVIGGAASPPDGNNDVWYSNDGANWQQATAAASWSPRYGHNCVVAQGKIWLTGGSIGNSFYNDVWNSSDGTNWQRATTSAHWSGRYRHLSPYFRGRLWIMNGYSFVGSYFQSDVWYSSLMTGVGDWTLYQ